MTLDVWNTCIFVPGFSREECAAWVQAIGSVLAILVAVLVAFIQHRQNQRERVTQHAQRLGELYAAPIAYVVEALELLEHNSSRLTDPQYLASSVRADAEVARMERLRGFGDRVAAQAMPTFASTRLLHEAHNRIDEAISTVGTMWRYKASPNGIRPEESSLLLAVIARLREIVVELRDDLARAAI